MKYFISFILILFAFQSAFGSEKMPVQTVKGTVLNTKNKQPVIGATVSLKPGDGSGKKDHLGTIADQKGHFKIEDVPVGRHQLSVSSVGYESKIIPIVVTSGKETVLNIYMNENFYETEEITVKGKKNSFQPINEAAMVSSTTFSVDDVQRFAGSRMDPARMAQNYAGVLGANDQRNDIIIRGGSPTELLWRIDGLDIPNPNHFATQGATGGPVSAINSMILDDSDFLTGAFPANYGNRLSGVFDLHTRRGNMENQEYYGQFGFNGFEFGAEGPIKKGNVSYLANYRYSFLDLLDKMGADFGFLGIPRYQDGSLKLDIFASEKHRIHFTGLFGISDIDIRESETDDVTTGDKDINNGTDFYGAVLNWDYLISDKFYTNLMLGSTASWFRTNMDSVTKNGNNQVTSIDKWFEQNSEESFTNIKLTANYYPNSRNLITAGTELRQRYYNFYERRFTKGWNSNSIYNLDKSGFAMQSLYFVNWNWRIIDGLTANIGFHSQYLDISNKGTFEPRINLEYEFIKNNKFHAGYGIHRQSLPLVLYYSDNENNNLDFMQAIHYVLGYENQLTNNLLLKIEGYFKDYSKVPVEANERSSWSFLNSGTNFGSVESGIEAKSKGLGKTYGAELTLMKHFADGYYYTLTGSYVRQRYKSSDNKWRWGAFDNQYILNVLGGYEYKISNELTLEFSAKYTLAGGKPYTPIDIERSSIRNSTYYLENEAYTQRMEDYSRFDLRLDLRHNMQNVSVISYFSLENVLDDRNTQRFLFDSNSNEVEKVYQMGRFFVGGVRVEF